MSIIVKRSVAGETVFTERRRGLVMFGVASVTLLLPGMFTLFLFEAGLSAGILVAGFLLAFLSLVFGGMAREALRHRNRVAVTSEAITLRRWSDGRETTFRRRDGDRLLMISRNLGRGLMSDRLLTQLGTGRLIALDGFSRGAVRRACERRGWSFEYDPGLGERQLRLWREWDKQGGPWLRYAASLVAARGPVDVAAKPGGRVALGAAILGAYASGCLPQGDQDYRSRQAKKQGYSQAAKAYRLAADAQRSFGALATSPRENAARLAEADRLESKALDAQPRPYVIP